jgi:hypothetical protein
MRFYVYKFNEPDKAYNMLILTEEDIEKESDKHAGAGYEILILPKKYKDVRSRYLDNIRFVASVRSGEIIYI